MSQTDNRKYKIVCLGTNPDGNECGMEFSTEVDWLIHYRQSHRDEMI